MLMGNFSMARLTTCSQSDCDSESALAASCALHALAMHAVVAATYCVLEQRHLLSLASQPKRLGGFNIQSSEQAGENES